MAFIKAYSSVRDDVAAELGGPIEELSEQVSGALPYGPLEDGVWKRFVGWLRLRLTGTGTVTIDARNALGVVTTIVPAMAITGATNTIIYPFPGVDATSIRATLTGSATAEIV